MIVNIPLMNTGVTPFTSMSNLRTGTIAGKSKVLASNIKASGNVIQAQVRQSISQVLSRGVKVNTKA
jgi:hypothetical protein